MQCLDAPVPDGENFRTEADVHGGSTPGQRALRLCAAGSRSEPGIWGTGRCRSRCVSRTGKPASAHLAKTTETEGDESVEKGGMLNHEEVAAVLTFVRNSFGNEAAPTEELLKEHPLK